MNNDLTPPTNNVTFKVNDYVSCKSATGITKNFYVYSRIITTNSPSARITVRTLPNGGASYSYPQGSWLRRPRRRRRRAGRRRRL